MLELLGHIPAGGSVFNALTVVIGSTLGLFIGKFIPEKLRDTIFNAMGLFILYVGINMCLSTRNSIAVLLSLVLGSVTGNLLGLEEKLNSLGDTIKARINAKDSAFTEGFVSATLVFCMGSMGIIGAFNDGLRHAPEVLVTKGIMDGISSVLFAGSMGLGVMFSAVPILVYQGALTFLAVWAEPFISESMFADISGLGGLMIMAIGLNFLKVTKLRLGDMLPGLVYVVVLSGLL